MAAVPHHQGLREAARGLSVLGSPGPASPVLVLAGELDLSTAARLTEVLQCAESRCPGSLVVDLQAVSFTDCAGARPLLEAARRLAARGARLDVCGALPRVALVLAHLGVPTVTVQPDVDPRGDGPPWPPAAT